MTTHETIHELPLDQLHESPHKPRRTFLAIEDLAASIKAEGRVLQPLLVRPRRPNPLRDDVTDGYELVFGHRRYRAAQLAGLASVPCMVRAMTDAEARSAQLAENLQRADVHPIEEAEGMAALQAHEGISADQLAERLGKSRSYVYGRLKLLQAVPQVRQACLEGKVMADVALLVARLPHPKLQEKALASINADTSRDARLDDGGQRSYRYLRDKLAEEFATDLQGAIFDAEDATLVPAAGPCSACPKRSGNAPEYADLVDTKRLNAHGTPYVRVGGPNVCTDPECFGAKKAAHLARKAEELQAQGKQVLNGNKARQALDVHGKPKAGYVEASAARRALKGKAEGKLQVVHALDQRSGKVVQLVKADTLPASAPKPQAATYAPQRHAEWRQREQAAAAATQSRLQLLQRVRAASMERAPGLVELQLLARAMVGSVYGTDDEEILEQLNPARPLRDIRRDWASLTAEDATRVVLDCLLVECVHVAPHTDPADYRAEALEALASLYGVPAEGVATPGPAAPAPEGAKPPRGVRYWNPVTGAAWSGKGLKPAWLRAALDQGRTLSEFEVPAAAPAKKARKVKDEASADGAGERDPNTRDMFETADAGGAG